MSKVTCFVLSFFLCICCSAQNSSGASMKIETWHSYPVPKDSSTLEKYAHDQSSWTVYSQNGCVMVMDTYYPVSLREKVPSDSLPDVVVDHLWKNENIRFRKGKGVLSVDDGFLIGINRGEFGGMLLWYSKDGRRHYKISDDLVVQFLRKDDAVYAIQGLNHLGSSEGSLIRIGKMEGKWKLFSDVKLPNAPVGIASQSDGHFVIATSNGILALTDDLKIITLIDRAIWRTVSYLYPESLVIQDDVAYVGMRSGVLKFNMKTKEQAWLMKD